MEDKYNNDAIKYAYEMYKREHDRWREWAFFFIGSITSIFIIWNQIKNELNIKIWLPLLLSSVIGLFWLFASLSIRATTEAWKDTIIELENNLSEKQVMKTFYDKLKNRKNKFKKRINNWNDLLDTINIFNEIWRKEYIFSVTRILVIIGLLLFSLFLGLSIYAFFDC